MRRPGRSNATSWSSVAGSAAARRGRTVCLLEETGWLGGQITSQGVSALDEHEYIEAFGGARTCYLLRETIRDHYRRLKGGRERNGPLNPDASWVSRLASETLARLALWSSSWGRRHRGRGAGIVDQASRGSRNDGPVRAWTRRPGHVRDGDGRTGPCAVLT